MSVFNPNLSPLETLDPIYLTAAAPRCPVDFVGTVIHCLSADEDFLVAVNKGAAKFSLSGNRTFRMPKDDEGRQTKFTSFELIRKTGAVVASSSVVLCVGDADYKDGNSAFRETIASALNGGIADKAPVATGGANATLLIASSTLALRKGVKIVNTGTVPLRIAGTDADAKSGTKGDYVFPMQAVFYPVVGALYGAGVGGVGACSVCEEVW